MTGIHAAVQGRVGTEPELRYTSGAKAMLTFSLAVDKKNGDEETEWLKVTAWEDVAEQLSQTLRKGHSCYAEGRMKLNSWTGQDGVERHELRLSAWVVQPLAAFTRPMRQTEAA